MKQARLFKILGISILSGGALFFFRLLSDSNKISKRRGDKFKSYYDVLNEWMKLKQEGKKIETFLSENHYQRIAIYGMGELGNRLYEELQESEIQVCFAIDQYGDLRYSELDVYDLNEDFPHVDAIIVTPVFDYPHIESILREKTTSDIISLKDVIAMIP